MGLQGKGCTEEFTPRHLSARLAPFPPISKAAFAAVTGWLAEPFFPITRLDLDVRRRVPDTDYGVFLKAVFLIAYCVQSSSFLLRQDIGKKCRSLHPQASAEYLLWGRFEKYCIQHNGTPI